MFFVNFFRLENSREDPEWPTGGVVAPQLVLLVIAVRSTRSRSRRQICYATTKIATRQGKNYGAQPS